MLRTEEYPKWTIPKRDIIWIMIYKNGKLNENHDFLYVIFLDFDLNIFVIYGYKNNTNKFQLNFVILWKIYTWT